MKKQTNNLVKQVGKTDLSLLSPRHMSLLNRYTLFFGWRLNEKAIKTKGIKFVLRFYDELVKLKPGQKREPVYTKEVTGSSMIKFDADKSPFTPGRIYLWEVAAYDEKDKLVSTSVMSRFGFKKDPRKTIDLGNYIMRATLPDLMPHAPIVWGCPVTVRFRSEAETETPAPEEEPDLPGELEPQALIWAAPAAVVALIPQTWIKCNLRWDYSRYENCHSVVLQIAGPFGFAYENASPDVLDDPNVAVAFTGPVTTNCAIGPLDDLTRIDSPLDTYSSQQFNLLNPDFWDELPNIVSLRLIPLDSEGTPDIASDIVSALCFDQWPGIDMTDVNVTWTWGDTPRREISFTVTTVADFDAGWLGMVDIPLTLVVGSWNRYLNDVEMTINGDPVTDRTIIEGQLPFDYPGYVMETNSWAPGNTYECRLVQEWPEYGGYTIMDLEEFAEAKIFAKCYPGIGANWAYCFGPMTAESCRLPDLAEPPECGPPLSASDINNSGWDQLFEYFNSTFTGTRTATTIEEYRYPPEELEGLDPGTAEYMEILLDDDAWRVETEETGRTEEDVTIRFSFPDNPVNGDEFHSSLLRTESPTMTETIDGSSRMYDFKWYGNHVVMIERFGDNRRYHGDTIHEMATIEIGELDSMAMHFRYLSATDWIGDHSLYRYDIIEYDLTI
jgi:hypothetical protein